MEVARLLLVDVVLVGEATDTWVLLDSLNKIDKLLHIVLVQCSLLRKARIVVLVAENVIAA